MRILIANEPRSYREVVRSALAAQRPHFDVMACEPDDLDHEIVRLRPHLVLCSRVISTTTTGLLTWIALYPQGARRVLVSVAGRQTAVTDLEFDRLLAIVDETEQLVGQTA